MIIKRNINGAEMEIELTDAEIREAYRIEQHNCDKADIIARLEYQCYDGDPDDMEIWFGSIETTVKGVRELMADDEAIEEMANDLRRTLDNHDGVSECLWLSCDDVIENYLEGRE